MCSSLPSWLPARASGVRKRAADDGIQRARKQGGKDDATQCDSGLGGRRSAGRFRGAWPVGGKEDADARRGPSGDRRDRGRSDEAPHDRRDRGGRRRREPHGGRAARRDVRGGRADFDRQGADRGALQEADELLRGPDQQRPHGDDDASATSRRSRAACRSRWTARSWARSASAGAASAAEDEELAVLGAAAVGAAPAKVSYFGAAQVREAFAKGAVLFDRGERYKVHATRRDGAGQAEVHVQDDRHHLRARRHGDPRHRRHGRGSEGDRRRTRVRGASIAGGETRQLQKGDVMIVPAGMPHWFQKVPASFTYYVVKVR